MFQSGLSANCLFEKVDSIATTPTLERSVWTAARGLAILPFIAKVFAPGQYRFGTIFRELPDDKHSVVRTNYRASDKSTIKSVSCIPELSNKVQWFVSASRGIPMSDLAMLPHCLHPSSNGTPFQKREAVTSQPKGFGETNMKSVTSSFNGNNCLARAKVPASLGLLDQYTPTQWVQLAGHEGSLVPTGTGSLLKLYHEREAICLKQLQFDTLREHVPQYEGEKLLGGTRYVQMQDLLHGVHSPSIMDCKLGLRTFLEEDVSDASGNSSRLRPDMYKKMIAVDPNAPTPDEHRQGAVTKLRYMQWREALSSTTSLSFRIEAVKKSDYPAQRDFKLTRTKEQVKTILRDFVQSDPSICKKYHQRLTTLKSALESSSFFADHEFIGSSLLFAHCGSDWAKVWMIDFAKTVHRPGLTLNHRTPWIMGNHEDGYLLGLDNLLNLFFELSYELI